MKTPESKTGSSLIKVSDIKHRNIMMVLSEIYASREGDGISQTDIVNRLGLKAPSVFRVFSYLEENGFIEQYQGKVGVQPQRKGRHPVFYKIKSNALYTIGVEFWSACLSIGVFDFNRRRVHSHLEYLKAGMSAEEVVAKIVNAVRVSLDVLNIPREKVIGMGVAAPGQININTGAIIFYPGFSGMVNYPIRDILQRELAMDVVVHNNCSALAYAVYRARTSEIGSSLFAFLIRGGVNGAMVSTEGIYTTANGNTLEAGHIPVNPEGPLCSCGLKGCLQAYIKQIDAIDRATPETDGSVLFDHIPDPVDEKSKATLDKAAYYIFSCMKTIQRTLAPDTFLIIGKSHHVAEAIAEGVQKLLSETTDHFQTRSPKVLSMEYDNLQAQLGASELALDSYFRS